MTPKQRLLISCQSGGFSYYDRPHPKSPTYSYLGHLPYHTLSLELEESCPVLMAILIYQHAVRMMKCTGQPYEIDAHTGKTVILGSARI